MAIQTTTIIVMEVVNTILFFMSILSHIQYTKSNLTLKPTIGTPILSANKVAGSP